MATLTVVDLSDPVMVCELDKRRIEVMRRMVENQCVRVDYRNAPDGLKRFSERVRLLESNKTDEEFR